MSTSYEAGLMVGLMFDDIVEAGFDQNKLESMIHDGDIAHGSYYYDSDPTENIIGLWVAGPDSYFEIDPSFLVNRISSLTKDFYRIFGIQPKLFSTLFVV